MFEVSRKRLTQHEIRALLVSLDPAFVERLAETINVEDYCRKLSDNAFLKLRKAMVTLSAPSLFMKIPRRYISHMCVSVCRIDKKERPAC